MTNEKKTNGTLDMVKAGKQFVTNTRTWATTVRDTAWAPMLTALDHNEALATTMKPVVEMTRTAHDRWLELYESQSHEMIDRTYDMMSRIVR